MKKITSILMILLFVFMPFASVANASEKITLTIDKNNISHKVSSNLYGLSLEDISYACDGGLVANLVNNNSFEYADNPQSSWNFGSSVATLASSDPINAKNRNYIVFSFNGKTEIENYGFTELYDYKTYDFNEDLSKKGDMGFKKDVSYDFSCYIKNIDFEGSIAVYLNSKTNSKNKYSINTSRINTKKWSKVTTQLESIADEDGSLVIEFDGKGSLQLDFVELIPTDSYGYSQDEWKNTTLRNDLYDAISQLNPSFIKFPGGCLVESDSIENLYSWKDTIGPVVERRQSYNISHTDNNKYNNSNFMGYHEYLQLCEDLNATAVPVLGAGITCQIRNNYEKYEEALYKCELTDTDWVSYLINEKGYDEKDEEGISKYTNEIDSLGINEKQDFEDYLDSISLRPGSDEFNNYIQDILDFIEYCNGSSTGTYWGAIRAQNGRETPFDIEYIEIGNDNWGDVYWRNFDSIYKAIKKKYPKLKVIVSSGTRSEGKIFDETWEKTSENYKKVMIDEHCYSYDSNILTNNDKYDGYDRDKSSVIVGNYCSKSSNLGKMITNNNLLSAIEESSYLTSFERNSDIVKMASYSSTFAKTNSNSTDENMIWFDSQTLVYTPNYFAQMICANNVGTEYINASFDSEFSSSKKSKGLFQSVTIDEDSEVIYVKLVNDGSKKNIHLDLKGFENVKYVSNMSLSHKYKSVSNEINKQRIAPKEEELPFQKDYVDLSIEKNSISVIRITYGNNLGTDLYTIPEGVDLSVRKYTPLKVRVGTFVGVVLFVLLVPALYIAYRLVRKMIRRKKMLKRKARMSQQ